MYKKIIGLAFVAALTLIASCGGGDDGGAGPDPSIAAPTGVTGQLPATLDGSKAIEIIPGKLSIQMGPDVLPDDVKPSDVKIAEMKMADIQGYKVLSAFNFEPSGTKFKSGKSASLIYTVDAIKSTKAALVYINSNNIVNGISSLNVDLANKKAMGKIEHFSIWAVVDMDRAGTAATPVPERNEVNECQTGINLTVTTTADRCTVGEDCQIEFNVDGGSGIYAYNWGEAASMPPGLIPSSESGSISGTPTLAGTYNLTIEITDANCLDLHTTISKRITIIAANDPLVRDERCNAELKIAPVIASCTKGSACEVSLTTSGGVGPYTYALQAGERAPDGLSISGDGKISGIPTSAGDSTDKMVVTDSGCNRSMTIDLNISIMDTAPICISAPTFTQDRASCMRGALCTVRLNPSGTGPFAYAYSLQEGQASRIPWPITYAPEDSSVALISGTPGNVPTMTEKVQITDGCGQSTVKVVSIEITSDPCSTGMLISPSDSSCIEGTPCSLTFTATGNVGQLSYSWSGLPDGIAANGNILSGTPTRPGIVYPTVIMTDAGCQNRSLTAQVKLDIKGVAPKISSIAVKTPAGKYIIPIFNPAPLRPTIEISFDREMDTASTAEVVQLLNIDDNSSTLPFQPTWNNTNRVLTITPTARLRSGRKYQVYIPTTAKSKTGVGLSASAVFQFTTRTIGDTNETSVSAPLYPPAADFIIGAPGAANSAGKAYLFDGGKKYLAADMLSKAFLTIQGEAAGDRLGERVEIAGDVDGDGLDEIMVSQGTDKILVFKGVQSSAIVGPSKAVMTISGGGAADWNIATFAGVGDINNDGFEEIAVGTGGKEDPNTHLRSPGKVYLFCGKNGMGPVTPEKACGSIVGVANDYLGKSIVGMGDLNGDMKDEVAIGAPLANRVYLLQGANIVMNGAATDLRSVRTLVGPALNSMFGERLAAKCDLNQDGEEELFISTNSSLARCPVRSLCTYVGNWNPIVTGSSFSCLGSLLAVGTPSFDNGKGKAMLYLGGQLVAQTITGNFGAAIMNLGSQGYAISAPKYSPSGDANPVGAVEIFYSDGTSKVFTGASNYELGKSISSRPY